MEYAFTETRNQQVYDLLLLADPSLAMINDYLPRSRVLSAQNNGRIIGVAVLLPTHPRCLEIINIAVDNEFQGQGIGQTLLNKSIEYTKDAGYLRVEIGTGNSSLAQLRLYQKMGFKISHIDTDYFVRNYPEPIFENGIQCTDMIRLVQDI